MLSQGSSCLATLGFETESLWDSCGGGEGFFEDGLEEVGGVGARVRDFPCQRTDAARQRRHARHTAR